MSESEGKRELAGLARSIDALFASAPPPATPDASAVAPVDEPTLDRAEQFVADDVVPEVEIAAAPEPVAATPVPILYAPFTVDEGDPPVAEAEAIVAEPNEDDEPEPTPLDLAVAAYVEGDLERADEIKRLAEGLLEQKEVDPIARAVATLAHAAGEPRDDSVYQVAEAIISPIVLGRLARRMGSERDEVRRQEYFVACRNIGKEMAGAIRNDLADSTDRLARRIHYDALIAMGDASRSTIEEMAVDENRFLVRNAVAILGEVGGAGANELVVSALANPDARVRREALLSLAKLGDEESGDLVLGLLEDPDAEVRRAAAIAAGELKVERALKTLIKALDSASDPDEVLPLIRSLGQLGDPGAVASIEKHAVKSMFSKSTAGVRINAYRALNTIGTPHARRLLNKAVSDKDPEVKAAVKEMLHIR
jgi:HEAT repeat protein